jgi:hypothetical protein
MFIFYKYLLFHSELQQEVSNLEYKQHGIIKKKKLPTRFFFNLHHEYMPDLVV